MDFTVTSPANKKILVKKYRISANEDAYSALEYMINKDCYELIQWTNRRLKYNPMQLEEITDYYCYQTVIFVFFEFKNKEDAVEFLLVNNIEV